MTKKIKWGKKVFIWLTLPDHSPSLKEVGTGTQAGAEAEAFVFPSSGLSSYIRAPTLFLVAALHDIVISWQVSSIFWCRSHGEGIAYWLAPYGLFLLLSYKTSPEMAPHTIGWAHPSDRSLIDKVPYSWTSSRHFLNWGSFVSDDSSLRQVDTPNQPVYY